MNFFAIAELTAVLLLVLFVLRAVIGVRQEYRIRERRLTVPMTRTQALIICMRPQNYAPTRVQEAATLLLDTSGATDEATRLSSAAPEGPKLKQNEPRAGST